MSASTVQQIKARFPLRALASMLGIELPRDGVKFRSPFRPDAHPSCTVKCDTFTDWSTNEHLDAIGFYAAAKNISNADAIKQLRAMAGGTSATGRVKVANAPKRTAPPITRPSIPEPIVSPSPKLIARTAASRGLSEEAFETARLSLGTLSYARLFETSCWILTDIASPGWEARRCDAEEFEPIGNQGPRKSHAKGPGIKSWPVGIAPPKFDAKEIDQLDPLVVLVEGGPDYIAAMELCWLNVAEPVLPCCMLGKCSDIAAAALPRFRGKRVAILGHDDAGTRIIEWAKQIRQAGAACVTPIKLGSRDLNDIARDRPEELPSIAGAIGIKL